MKFKKVHCEISEPVLLNCWKHHAGFIKSKISVYKRHPENFTESLRKEILSIGGSLMDLYLGDLLPSEIALSIIASLDRQKVNDIANYREWLGEEGNGYREIEIEDHSKWTLRLGERADRYIHIHPSRYSEHSIRVRSSSLKSAVLFCVLSGTAADGMLAQTNMIRKDYLGLPPLKSIKSGSAFLNLVKILAE